MEIEEIKQKAADQIEAAFADTPMPAKGNYWLGPYECEGIEDHIGGVHWKEIPLQILIYNRECLNYLTPEAFRFYVPAYMLIVLRDPKRADTLVDRIVSDLSPSIGHSYSDWYNRRLKEKAKALIPKEAEGIIAFLEAYQALMKADDEYYTDDFFIFGTKGSLEHGILFWMYVRDGVDFPF